MSEVCATIKLPMMMNPLLCVRIWSIMFVFKPMFFWQSSS